LDAGTAEVVINIFKLLESSGMLWIDLKNPCLNGEPKQYEPVIWELSNIEVLPPPVVSTEQSIESIINSRRSRRDFGLLTREQLSTILWLSCRTIEKKISDIGIPIERRPVASSGAIHPIHVLIGKADSPWFRYNTDNHTIEELCGSMVPSTNLFTEVTQVLPPGDASILLFVAEPEKVFAKYDNANSLIWRDAGVLLGHLAIVAESLKLNFCPLGITGEPWVSNLDKQNRLFGVGVALIGAR
jgi:hypothetical protein